LGKELTEASATTDGFAKFSLGAGVFCSAMLSLARQYAGSTNVAVASRRLKNIAVVEEQFMKTGSYALCGKNISKYGVPQ
jgi:hypothetical protein